MQLITPIEALESVKHSNGGEVKDILCGLATFYKKPFTPEIARTLIDSEQSPEGLVVSILEGLENIKEIHTPSLGEMSYRHSNLVISNYAAVEYFGYVNYTPYSKPDKGYNQEDIDKLNGR